MKIAVLIFSIFHSIIFGYSQNTINDEKCIPLLIHSGKSKVYIEDSTVKDTLKIQFHVSVNFEHPLVDTTTVYVVKSVDLINLIIRSTNPQKIISSLSNVVEIKSPWEQYIWNLCYAKLSYWYNYQPYMELPEKERTRYGDKVYMGGILYLAPKYCKLIKGVYSF